VKRGLAVVIMAVAIGAFAGMPGASANGIRIWTGETNQGLPLQFTVVTDHGKTFIPVWKISFQMLCEKDGSVFGDTTEYRGFDVPVVNGKFSYEDPYVQDWYFHWKGSIGRGKAHGVAALEHPAFTGHIKLQVCTSGAPPWTATRGGAVGSSRIPSVSFLTSVVRHPDGSISRTVTAISH